MAFLGEQQREFKWLDRRGRAKLTILVPSIPSNGNLSDRWSLQTNVWLDTRVRERERESFASILSQSVIP